MVKILDFGLAKLAGRAHLTLTGTTIGTIAYMSPEQALGQEVDQRSDIWSLGVVLYQMLSSQLPFMGDYEQAIIYSIINGNPTPLSELVPGLPAELYRIVNKTLEKDRDKRLCLYETGHFIPKSEMIKETLNWLDHYWGPVK